MICPKCKSPVMEIRGEYFCSQCGSKVDLNEIEESLKEEIVSAKKHQVEVAVPQEERNFIKTHTDSEQQEGSSSAISDSKNEGQGVQEESVVSREDSLGAKEEQVQTSEQRSYPTNESVSTASDASSEVHSFSPRESVPSPLPQVFESPSPEEKLLHSYSVIRLLLIVIVALNVLIILGAIYFFTIK